MVKLIIACFVLSTSFLQIRATINPEVENEEKTTIQTMNQINKGLMGENDVKILEITEKYLHFRRFHLQ